MSNQKTLDSKTLVEDYAQEFVAQAISRKNPNGKTRVIVHGGCVEKRTRFAKELSDCLFEKGYDFLVNSSEYFPEKFDSSVYFIDFNSVGYKSNC